MDIGTQINLESRAHYGRQEQLDALRVALWRLAYVQTLPPPPEGISAARWRAMVKQGVWLEELAEDLETIGEIACGAVEEGDR